MTKFIRFLLYGSLILGGLLGAFLGAQVTDPLILAFSSLGGLVAMLSIWFLLQRYPMFPELPTLLSPSPDGFKGPEPLTREGEIQRLSQLYLNPEVKGIQASPALSSQLRELFQFIVNDAEDSDQARIDYSGRSDVFSVEGTSAPYFWELKKIDRDISRDQGTLKAVDNCFAHLNNPIWSQWLRYRVQQSWGNGSIGILKGVLQLETELSFTDKDNLFHYVTNPEQPNECKIFLYCSMQEHTKRLDPIVMKLGLALKLEEGRCRVTSADFSYLSGAEQLLTLNSGESVSVKNLLESNSSENNFFNLTDSLLANWQKQANSPPLGESPSLNNL